MFSEVGPSDALAAKASSGRKLNERNVNKDVYKFKISEDLD